MTVYDATFSLTPQMPVWPGDPSPKIEAISHLKNGDSATTSAGYLSFHTGTHVDTPAHVIPGAPGISDIPPNKLIGPVTVIEVPEHIHHISLRYLQELDFQSTRRVFFKTRNTQLWRNQGLYFTPHYTAFLPEAAQFLAAHHIQMVGIDGFSVDEFEATDLPVHHIFLSAGIIIVELLNLMDIPGGEYLGICAPLKVAQGDGAPARVFLIPWGKDDFETLSKI